jgi:hypothetical protein
MFLRIMINSSRVLRKVVVLLDQIGKELNSPDKVTCKSQRNPVQKVSLCAKGARGDPLLSPARGTVFSQVKQGLPPFGRVCAWP